MCPMMLLTAGGGDLVVADDGEELQQALGADLAAFHELAETQACMVNESVAVKACLAAQQTRISVVFDEILAQGDPNGGDWDEDQRAFGGGRRSVTSQGCRQRRTGDV